MKDIVVDEAILDEPQEIPEDIRKLMRCKRNSHLETDSAIVVKGLKKTCGEDTIINEGSFEVEHREIIS